MNAAQVLLMLRDGSVSDVNGLCAALDLSPTVKGLLLGMLEDLEEAELILSDPPVKDLEMDSNARIKLSNKWPIIQRALGLSLKELASVDLSNAMFVEPFFGRPDTVLGGGTLDLFVLMPFLDDLKPVYEDHIKAVAKKLKLSIKRGDDFFTSHHVMKDIWEAICGARFIIADCTGRNPNVFYEIGMAHTAGKEVILITQNAEDVPFDLRQLRYIQFKYTPPGMKEFEKKLTETIKWLL
jgi:DNA-binding transcriptional ArsR family regulator